MTRLLFNAVSITVKETRHQVKVITSTEGLSESDFKRLKRNAVHFGQERDGQLWEANQERLDELTDFYFVHWEEEVADMLPQLPQTTITFDINMDIRLAKAWLQRQLVQYFRQKGYPCRQGFIGEVEVFCPLPTPNNHEYRIYKKYALSPRYRDQCDGWQLNIMPLGQSLASTTSATQLNLGNKSFSVIVGTEVVKWKHIDDRYWIHKEKGFYPIANRDIARLIGCDSNHRHDKNKYVTKNNDLLNFINHELKSATFAQALDIEQPSANDLILVKAENTKVIDDQAKSLTTGSGNSTLYLRNEFVKGGCAVRPTDQYTYFFIYPEGERETAEKIYDIFTNGQGNQVKNIVNYTHQPPIWVGGLSIAYPSTAPLPHIVDELNSTRFENGKKYMAIVLLKHKKSTSTEKDNNFYNQLKLELLRKDIQSQMICLDTINTNPNFKYTMDNMAAAIVAKQGGSPWRLAHTTTSRDLIVGVGASRKDKKTYLGSAFYFDFLGNYYQFDCCKANDLGALRNSITKDIIEFVRHRKAVPDRLIIHYYKTMNRRESAQVEHALQELKLQCPVYVVNMVDATSEDLIAFDMQSQHLMPLSGTIIHLRPRQYLLYCNERFSDDSMVHRKLFPIKLTITPGQSTPDTDDILKVEHEIITQAYQFCRLYYRSVSTQNKPITIAYTELFAQAVANSPNEELNDFKDKGLWMI